MEKIDMSACGRHGYAIYRGNTIIAWCMTPDDAALFTGDNITVRNVQNGAAFN